MAGPAGMLLQGHQVPDTVGQSANAANDFVQKQRMLEGEQRGQAEAIVRQERQNPNKKVPLNTKSATGGMTPTGRERDTTNLTDAEKVLSESYVHEGMAQRIYQEECSGDNRALCQGQDPSNRGMMIQMLARAYGMVVGAMGGKMTRRPSSDSSSGGGSEPTGDGGNGGTEGGEGTAQNESSEKDKEMNDYCRFIAIGTEAFAMFQQEFAQSGLSKLPHNADTAQRDSLLKAAVSHEERAKQAKFQTMGWGATAACYWSMLAFAQVDWQLGLKIGGSTLLAVFFHQEIGRQEGYAEKIRALADKMPGKGDCNPITERLCYCAQPETMNDPDFCLNEMRQRHISENTFMNTTCIDGQAKADPECRCLDSDSCFDRRIENSLRGVGFGNMELQGIRPIQEMSRGSLSEGTLANTGRQVSALNNRLARSPEIKDLMSSRNLTPEQRKQIESLNASGVNPTLSRLMAYSPPTAASPENINRFSDMNEEPNLNGTNVVNAAQSSLGSTQFRGGHGLSDSYYQNNNSNDPIAGVFDRFKKGEEREPASNVLTFAERAERNAQITRRPDTPIFDIISNRYRLSAWTRLPMDIPDDDKE